MSDLLEMLVAGLLTGCVGAAGYAAIREGGFWLGVFLGGALLFAGFGIGVSVAQARTIQQDLDVAHAHWQTDVCRGEWRVVPDESLLARRVVASTFLVDCTILIAPGVTGCVREDALVHEVGHFVHGRAHTGPMADRALERRGCVGELAKQRRVKARWLRDRQRIRRWWRS